MAAKNKDSIPYFMMRIKQDGVPLMLFSCLLLWHLAFLYIEFLGNMGVKDSMKNLNADLPNLAIKVK